MRSIVPALVLVLVLNHVVNAQKTPNAGEGRREVNEAEKKDEDEGHYLNEWAAEIPGGEENVRSLAKRYGYEVVKRLPSLADHYILRRHDVPHRSRRSAHHHTRRLVLDQQVSWAEQQIAKSRVKRAVPRVRQERAVTFNDPMLREQWYINGMGDSNRVSERGNLNHLDLRVEEVWRRGITGKGVVLSVLDDGIERDHKDLQANYDPYASYDLNSDDHDPMPRYDPTNENKHGTRCAGEIAMVADNGKCGVGIAYNSSIGGVRMLDGKVTDSIEAQALTFNHTYVDIFSASWGPNDDGVTVEGPGHLASKALFTAITEGRGGKGSIFAWASGNGGRMKDNCNCDGYTSSPYTLSVSSVSEHGEMPWYSERCSSTFTTTYSSGNGGDHQVVSSDLHNECTSRHTGTSAAAPMAAGIFALLLEANPDVTWRDVQHLVAWTSKIKALTHNAGWYRNAAGFCVNLAFGFGLLDALALVEMANPESWVNVPEQHTCVVPSDGLSNLPQELSSGNVVEVDIVTDGCHGQDNEVNYLEHLQLELTLSYSKRGAISVLLISPSGTETVLMEEREWDKSNAGFTKWPLMSVHTWGEDPKGKWRLKVIDKDSGREESGRLENVVLKLHGTKDQPDHMKRARHNCDAPLNNQEGSTKQGAMEEMQQDNRQENFFRSLIQNYIDEHKVNDNNNIINGNPPREADPRNVMERDWDDVFDEIEGGVFF